MFDWSEVESYIRTIAQDKAATFMTMVCPESSTGIVHVLTYLLHSTAARASSGRHDCVAAALVAHPALRLRGAWAGLCGLHHRKLAWSTCLLLQLHLAKVRPSPPNPFSQLLFSFLFVSELPR